MKDDIEGAGSYLDTHIYELKTAMLLCGAANVKELRSVPKIITGNLKEWISELHTEPGDSE